MASSYRNESATELPEDICPSLDIDPPSDGKRYCPPAVDVFPWTDGRITFCWNYTEAGTSATALCPDAAGLKPFEYAIKNCTLDGTWALNVMNNQSFVDILPCVDDRLANVAVMIVYLIGYSISILTLSIALVIFFSFRQLQCDRLTLHKHLFISNLVNAIFWIIYYILLGFTRAMADNWTSCIILHLIASYVSIAMYFWMFNEGLYLVIILVITFISSGKRLINICIFIGWGLPFLLILLYGILRWVLEDPISCWTKASPYSYLIYIPIIISLSINFVFVIIIFVVLLTKLRSHVSADQQQGKKAAKAILILVPLLGIQYIFTFVQPETGFMSKAHPYLVACLVSFQGMLVAVLFCFMNQEVHSAIKSYRNRRRYLSCEESSAANAAKRRASRVTYTSRDRAYYNNSTTITTADTQLTTSSDRKLSPPPVKM